MKLKNRYLKQSYYVTLTAIFITTFVFFLKTKTNFKNVDENKNSNTTVSKIHISYVHYLNSKDERTVQNFKFFFHFAYEPCHADVDFTITLNIDTETLTNLSKDNTIFGISSFLNAFPSDQTLLARFKSCSNINNPLRNTYLILRENIAGGDLCANVDFFKSDFWIKNKLSYKYYFFINSSARGPFLPNYWLKKWLIFIHLSIVQ